MRLCNCPDDCINDEIHYIHVRNSVTIANEHKINRTKKNIKTLKRRIIKKKLQICGHLVLSKVLNINKSHQIVADLKEQRDELIHKKEMKEENLKYYITTKLK